MSPRNRRSRALAVALGPTLVIVAAACSRQAEPPRTLVEAREEFQRAKQGPAMALDPTDVHEADLALQRAEQAWRSEPGDPSTSDLAVVADRRALLAQSEASAMQSRQTALVARQQVQAATATQLQSAQSQLGQTEQALGATQMQLQAQQTASSAQAQQLQEMQAKLKDARDTIARIASVKDDDRGMVITLQGEVLFPTGKWTLKPGAMAKLDQIAAALQPHQGMEQRLTVDGYTDDVGGVDMNMELSQKRAQSVRDYLVTKGIPQDLVTAEGKGPGSPVSANTSVEGRAMNRRVEIVVQPKTRP